MTAVLIETRKPCSLTVIIAFIFVIIECPIPLFWDNTSSSCVTQCPLFTFGKHTLAPDFCLNGGTCIEDFDPNIRCS